MEQNQNKAQKIFSNGSVWLRADFHLHTIKDKEFSKIDVDQEEFVPRFVDKLEAEQINIGLITNHNKFDREEFKRIKKLSRKRGIWIIPGVELSVNDGANGIHCLIAFDENSWLKNEDDFINQFLIAAFEGIPNRENSNANCKYSLNDVFEKLEEHHQAGRDSFIILAHVNEDNGFLKELSGGRILNNANSALFRKYVLGFQKFRVYDTLEIAKHWFGEVLPAFVEGSDCKSLSSVGKPHIQGDKEKKTYIKIGDFNFEALKFALSDYTHRVRNELPNSCCSYIKSIGFEGGKLDGQILNFSPEINNFIGIRGSGKSSVIELLRYALDIPLSHSSTDTQYKNNLISYILGSGGKITLTLIDSNRREYKLTKIYGQKENIFDSNGSLCNCPINCIFENPVYFGQKDLSNKQDCFQEDLVNRLIGNRLVDVNKSIDAKKREIRTLLFEIQKIQNVNILKEDIVNKINAAHQKLQYYKDQGVEEKLKIQTFFDTDVLKLYKKREDITSFFIRLKDFTKEFKEIIKDISLSEVNTEAMLKVNNAIAKIKNAINQIELIYDSSFESAKSFIEVLQSIEQKRDGMREEFAKIKRELNSDTLNPDTFLNLNRIINASTIQLEELDKQEQKRLDLFQQLLKELSNLNDLWKQEFDIIDIETSKINKANSYLKINVQFKMNKAKYYEQIKSFFKGIGLREASIQNLLEKYSDFIEIYRDRNNLSNILSESQLVAFNNRFNDNLFELLTYKVPNLYNIEYKGKSIDNHSLGQRASALILFLLAQKDTNVLIIDQPEDDLDNQTIYDEVIKELLNLKGNMQFIFATHNANIPVLGDSEKVFACHFDNQTITINDGTIDSPSIQQSIVSIMEGGADAFDKRKNRYMMWDIK